MARLVGNAVVRNILRRLSASIHGQIFLLNLDAGIADGLIKADLVSLALKVLRTRDINLMHEKQLLGRLKQILQSPTATLALQHDHSADMDTFLKGDHLITAMSWQDFKTWYDDPAAMISGHDFARKVIGAHTIRFRVSAKTRWFCWVAPKYAFGATDTITRDAERARDALGMVDVGKSQELVALHFETPRRVCYRPTAVEALRNTRFRQIDPGTPHEGRWGRTVDLALLDSWTPGASIGGVPELLIPELLLKDCSHVSFYYLGKTNTDRDTSTADQAFLAHLFERQKDSIKRVLARLDRKLAK